MEYAETETPVSEHLSSVGAMISELFRDFGTLFRQELRLATCELTEKADEAKGGATKCGIAAGMGLAAVVVLSAAIVLGLTLLLSLVLSTLAAAFVSALLVGIGLGVAAYLLFRQGGKDLSPSKFVPERTLESLKENTRWAKTHV